VQAAKLRKMVLEKNILPDMKILLSNLLFRLYHCGVLLLHLLRRLNIVYLYWSPE
jgi:hypothetical protein